MTLDSIDQVIVASHSMNYIDTMSSEIKMSLSYKSMIIQCDNT